MDKGRVYENPEMPGHERDQHDAEILDALRATMLHDDGSYLVVCLRPAEDDDHTTCDAVCVLAGNTTIDRLVRQSMLVDVAKDRLAGAAETVIRHAMTRPRNEPPDAA